MDRLDDPLFDVTGKSIIIAGACGGLGRAMAAMLADRGAQLTLADIDAAALEALAKEIGGRVHHLVVDVTDEAATQELMPAALRVQGSIDGLINATGIFVTGAADEFPLSDFQRSMEINVAGALLLSRAAAAHMDNGGSILHIASVSSSVANPHYAAYASSKAALSQLVRVLAREWAPRNIRVNALGPAMTETPLTAPKLSDDAFNAQALASIPMGRFGQPHDLLAPTLLLMAPGGSFITGQTIYVDGGRTLV